MGHQAVHGVALPRYGVFRVQPGCAPTAQYRYSTSTIMQQACHQTGLHSEVPSTCTYLGGVDFFFFCHALQRQFMTTLQGPILGLALCQILQDGSRREVDAIHKKPCLQWYAPKPASSFPSVLVALSALPLSAMSHNLLLLWLLRYGTSDADT